MFTLTPRNLKGCKRDVDFDEILDDVGHFGTYQVFLCMMVMVTSNFYGMYAAQYHWNAEDVNYRCVVPECESPPYNYEPGNWSSFTLFKETKEQCERRNPKGKRDCTEDSFHTNQTQICIEWVYEHSNTIVADFNLACQGRACTLVGTVHTAGVLTSLAIAGFISDSCGRKSAYIMMILSSSVMGILRSSSLGFGMYLTFEYLEASLGAGIYSTGYVLALEITGISRRVAVGSLIACAYPVGNAVLSVLACYYPYWRNLTLCIYTPPLILFVYYFTVDESPRWLFSKGKKKEAIRIIKRVAKRNRLPMTRSCLRMLGIESEEEAKEGEPTTSMAPTDKYFDIEQHLLQHVIARLIRSKTMMTRVAICTFWWMTQMFVFYGISLNFTMTMGGNKFVSAALVGFIEVPGYFASFLVLDRMGRKRTIILGFFMCGITLMAIPYLPVWSRKVFYVLGKFAISMVANSNYVYTFELFPTEARQSLMNFCSMLGRIGQICALQTPVLMEYWKPLPFLTYGVTAWIAGGLMMMTPETINTRLPDTVAEAEDLELDY